MASGWQPVYIGYHRGQAEAGHATSMDNAVYVWDGAQYLVGTTSGNTLPGNIVPAMQGFFMHAYAIGASLTIPADARVHSSQSFYKNSNATKDVLYLTIEGNTYKDQAVVCFNPASTTGFDSQYDAYKLFGITAAPQLYSILPGIIATVNSLPSITATERVPLGLKVGNSTTYTLTASGIESFDATVPITLIDVKLGNTQDLRINPSYTFTAAPGDAENRFNLSFTSAAGVNLTVAGDIHIYGSQGTIHIKQSNSAKGTAYVYTTTGQLLATTSLTPDETLLRVNATGVYIVKVITDKEVFSGKVVINQP